MEGWRGGRVEGWGVEGWRVGSGGVEGGEWRGGGGGGMEGGEVEGWAKKYRHAKEDVYKCGRWKVERGDERIMLQRKGEWRDGKVEGGMRW